jgi:hypothetical protein
LRWRKTAVGGETTLSGLDDTALTLSYTPNYEQVYINGVLQVRGQDYTATNGTSITGLTALAANDVVEILGTVARQVADVYTQAQTNSLLDAKSNVSTTGLVLVSSTSVTSSATININNCFTSAYQNYQIHIVGANASSLSGISYQLTSGGTANTAGYYSANVYIDHVGGPSRYVAASNGSSGIIGVSGAVACLSSITISRPAQAAVTTLVSNYVAPYPTNAWEFGTHYGYHNSTSSFDGFVMSLNSFTGTIKVYGYK